MNFNKLYFEWLEATVGVMNSQFFRGVLILGLGPLFFIWLSQNAPFLGVGMATAGVKLATLVGIFETFTGLKNFDRDMDISRLKKRLGVSGAKQIEQKN